MALAAILLAALIPSWSLAQQESAPNTAPAKDPRLVIEEFHSVLLDVMQNADELGFDGRRERLAPEIDKAYNLPLMLHWIVGPKAWSEITDDQRDRLLSAFKRMTLNIYASRFNGYSGQHFETVEERDGMRNDILVRTELISPNGNNVALDYLLRVEDNQWRIVDVFFKRISELATRKSEYNSVIRRQGINALIDELEAKANEIEAQALKS
jgi:phospholipid transport system substrate-binding protein